MRVPSLIQCSAHIVLSTENYSTLRLVVCTPFDKCGMQHFVSESIW